jgi:hypothetical protein
MPCVNHPDVLETAHCELCRLALCDDCYVVVAGRALCANCKDDAVRRLERGELLSAVTRIPAPWERERTWRAFRETFKRSLLHPQEFFGTLNHQGSAAYLGYAVLVAWPPIFMGQMIVLVLQGTLMGLGGAFGRSEAAVGLGMLVMMTAIYFVFTPVSILLQVVMGGLILHGCLKLCGGAHAPLEATLRTVAYAQSSQVFAFVPFLGPIVSWGWGLGLQVVGIKAMHETDYGRVLAAVFLPLLFCCMLCAPMVLVFALIALARQ